MHLLPPRNSVFHAALLNCSIRRQRWLTTSPMPNATKHAVVFGGSGFIGKYVTQALVADPAVQVQVVCRHPQPTTEARFRQLSPQVLPFSSIDITDPRAVIQACQGATHVVNLVGIMHETSPKYTFDAVQHRGAANVAQAAKQAHARLVHMSAIGANPYTDIPYAKTKGLGEQAVRATLPDANVFRPSLVFGREDMFFNRFVQLSKFLPFMPVFGGGRTKFQPVYVKDLAQGIAAALLDPQCNGLTIEAGGPKVYTYRQLLELTLFEAEIKRPIISLPWSIGMIQAWFLEKLPPNLFTLTRDQLRLLQQDNMVSPTASTLEDLGVRITPAESVLHTWLDPGRCH
ncbi:pantoate-beta-alanine ligase [Dimargaris xerosporica]|nr:pantoate-beta-alanine ligase [Dimargaris xerosporica]